MSKNWVIRESKSEDLIQDLLLERGLNLEFDYDKQLHDPFLMKDMDKAVKRLLSAIEKGEKIMIFADYDADGVPGAAALATFFKKINFTNYVVYIPDRHNEDHGLSSLAVDEAVKNEVDLIITIDCGISNASEVAYAKKKKVEVIITDHHLVPEEIPKAVAVVDPKRGDDEYPYKFLCGAGVIFKVIQAITTTQDFSRFLGKNPQNTRKVLIGFEKWLLDLIAIATISDMVPLTGENRALAYFGLKVLRRSPRPGIVELCRALRIKQEFLTEDDIGFLIGPRINAASRMAHAREAFELLTTDDVAVAATIAGRLEKLNKERRKCVDEILSNVEDFPNVLGNDSQQKTFLGSSETIPRTQEKFSAASLLVIGHESWSLGVLGLTAARLVEKYKRPVFIWGKNGNGVIKGSCRSDGSVNVVELMRNIGEDFFINVGGHHHAGGFSLDADKISELELRLNSAFAAMDKNGVAEEIVIDAEMEPEAVTLDLYRKLERLAPFGIENPKPVFLLPQVKAEEVKCFGNDKSHLELTISGESGKKLKAISFFNTFADSNLQPNQLVDLAVSVELSYFKYQPELRLRIVDLRKAG